MTKDIAVDGDEEFIDKFCEFWKNKQIREVITNSNLGRIEFEKDQIRKIEVDGINEDRKVAHFYNLPETPEEFDALVEFATLQIDYKKKTEFTREWIIKEHAREVKEIIGSVNYEIPESFGKIAYIQIGYANNSVIKCISYNKLNTNKQKVIEKTLHNNINPELEDIDWTSLYNDNCWKDILFGTKFFEKLRNRIKEEATIISETQLALLRSYGGPSPENIKKSAKCLTKLVFTACGWKPRQEKVEGPYV